MAENSTTLDLINGKNNLLNPDNIIRSDIRKILYQSNLPTISRPE